MSNLSKEIIFSQLDSEEEFPIQFEDAWNWLEYSRKDVAKTSLLGCDFAENIDYVIRNKLDSVNHSTFSAQEKASAKREEVIKLTVDCFKQWCMMSRTAKGKEVRLWYLKVEKEWRDAKEKEKNTQQPIHMLAGEVSDQIKRIHDNLSDIDPRLAQILKDRAMQSVVGNTQPSEDLIDGERLEGCVWIAEQNGFKVGKEESVLGRTVAKAWREATGTEPQVVEREVGGGTRKIKAYPCKDTCVIETIKAFYEKRAAS